LQPSEPVRESGVPGLCVLTAGVPSSNPADLLESARFKQVLQIFQRRFEWVIIDSPPVLPVADAPLMAREGRAVLMVVRAEKTDLRAAREAVEQLHHRKARIVGAVLNDANVRRHAGYYAPYYGSQYQGYHRSSQQFGSRAGRLVIQRSTCGTDRTRWARTTARVAETVRGARRRLSVMASRF
jgi:Mrp family chromosome partitioning ATPase